MIDYKEQYYELLAELKIHHSHDHERVLKYVAVHNDRVSAAQAIMLKTREFLFGANEIEKRAW